MKYKEIAGDTLPIFRVVSYFPLVYNIYASFIFFYAYVKLERLTLGAYKTKKCIILPGFIYITEAILDIVYIPVCVLGFFLLAHLLITKSQHIKSYRVNALIFILSIAMVILFRKYYPAYFEWYVG